MGVAMRGAINEASRPKAFAPWLPGKKLMSLAVYGHQSHEEQKECQCFSSARLSLPLSYAGHAPHGREALLGENFVLELERFGGICAASAGWRICVGFLTRDLEGSNGMTGSIDCRGIREYCFDG